jgi:putative PIN family toxin of toxin-antitoxin system
VAISGTVDTNIFVSGTLIKRGVPYELVQAFADGRFLLITSAFQRAEIDRVLRKPSLVTKYNITDLDRLRLLRRIDRQAIVVTPTPIVAGWVRDPNDEPILGTALAGRADYLVSGDEDLLVLAGDARLGSLRIVTARTFLDLLQS